MTDRLDRITTRTGDQGITTLANGEKVSKTHLRIECLGSVDEFNSIIGLALATIDEPSTVQMMRQVQHDLFDVGAELSQPGKQLLTSEYAAEIERWCEQMNQSLPPLKEFILPGGSTEIAYLHLARTVCRRAERDLLRLSETEAVNPETVKFLNRLSDFLFVLARDTADKGQISEQYWQSQYSRLKPETKS